MATKTAEKQRTVSVLIGPDRMGEGHALIEIRDNGERTIYFVDRIGSDWGTAFKFDKLEVQGGESYHVNLGADDTPPQCDCPGGTYRDRCKHIDCATALVQSGKL